MAASTSLLALVAMAAMGVDDPATRDPRIKVTPNPTSGGDDTDGVSGERNASRRADMRGILTGRHMSGGASPTLLTGAEGAKQPTRRRALLGE